VASHKSAKAARFKASLSSTFGRGTVPAQPFTRLSRHSAFAFSSLCKACVFSKTNSLIIISYERGSVYYFRDRGWMK